MALYKVDSDTADLTKVAGGTLWADSPIGSILPYGGTSAPSGWMICDGSALSRTTYSELFTVIGTAFGVGDGSTTFNLPDMRESVPKGAGLTGKTVGAHVSTNGLSVGEFIDDRVQAHTHSVPYVAATGSGAFTWGFANERRLGESSGITNNNSGRSGATTEVKSVGVNYIIKAKMVAVPADFMSAVDDAVETAMTKYDYTIPYAEQNTLEKVVKELVRRIASDSSIPSRSTFNVFLEWQSATIIQVNVAKFNSGWVVVNGSSADAMFWGGQVNDEWKWHQS